jgi:hypothetical protein
VEFSYSSVEIGSDDDYDDYDDSYESKNGILFAWRGLMLNRTSTVSYVCVLNTLLPHTWLTDLGNGPQFAEKQDSRRKPSMNRKLLSESTCRTAASACSTKTGFPAMMDNFTISMWMVNILQRRLVITTVAGWVQKVMVEAKDGNLVLGQVSCRSITAGSVFLAFFTYFTSLYWYEAYPDEITIPINISAGLRKKVNNYSWDAPYKDSEDSETGTATSQWDQPFR